MRISLIPTLAIVLSFFLGSCSKEDSILDIEDDGKEEFIPVDLTARNAAKKLYTDYYIASKTESPDVAWSGDEPSCNPGTVPQKTMDKIFMRIEYFRRAAGLTNSILENETKSEKAQHAALMMKSNGTLDHSPPDSWKCYTVAGKDGAGNSLLTQSKNGEAIDSYMRDAGSANGPVGHRRWLLWPKLQEIGVGNTNTTNAVWVLGNAGPRPTDAPEFISWPPKGYIPKQFAYSRWSFSIANADFTAATVTIKDANNKSIELDIEELNNSYGDRAIVWVPVINTNSQNEDTTFTVNVKNVGIGSELKDFEYEIILFDGTD